MSQPIDIIEETDKLSIQLGDIVEIIAPTDPALNNHTFYMELLIYFCYLHAELVMLHCTWMQILSPLYALLEVTV